MINLTWTRLTLSLKSCFGEQHDHQIGASKPRWQLPPIYMQHCILEYDIQVRGNTLSEGEFSENTPTLPVHCSLCIWSRAELHSD